MWTGMAAFMLCLFIGSINTQFIHYWLTMVILGIGWNFLFPSGTNLLRYGYREEERFKLQSFNDFLVFSIQGIASLSSGWFLYHWGWQGVLYASIPLVVAFALLAWFSKARDPSHCNGLGIATVENQHSLQAHEPWGHSLDAVTAVIGTNV
jgi:MFS family permease